MATGGCPCCGGKAGKMGVCHRCVVMTCASCKKCTYHCACPRVRVSLRVPTEYVTITAHLVEQPKSEAKKTTKKAKKK